MLQALGLDDTGQSVYMAMLAGPASCVADLSARTGLPEAQVRAATEKLASLGLVRADGDAPQLWTPVSPELGLAAIVRREEVDLAPRDLITGQGAAAAAYAVAHSTSSHIERLDGPESVAELAKDLARDAASEVLVTLTAPQASSGWQADGIRDRCRARIRVLCRDSVRGEQAAMAQAALLAGSGADVRTSPSPPPVLMISDRRAALVPLSTASPRDGAICVREPVIVAILAAMFAGAWDAAAPLSANPSAAARAVSDDERVLLQLLAEGLTDEATARRLGVSVRTARRQISALMDKLGASSRFQAGHQAAQRGWL